MTKARGQIPSTASLKQLEAQSPGLFNSGYFVLAAVQGATRNQRNAATLHGQPAARRNRRPDHGRLQVRRPATPASEALGSTLASIGQRFGETHNAAGRGRRAGREPRRPDLGHQVSGSGSTSPSSPWRSRWSWRWRCGRCCCRPWPPSFSLLVVAGSFGLLQLLFGGSDPLLGGPGYLDPITIISMFTVAFGITRRSTCAADAHPRGLCHGSAHQRRCRG